MEDRKITTKLVNNRQNSSAKEILVGIVECEESYVSADIIRKGQWSQIEKK